MPDRRYRLYLDTSFWNRLADRQNFQMRRDSYHFLNRACAKHEILVSPLVVAEVQATPDPEERRIIERLLRRQRPVRLGYQPGIAAIARELRDAGGWGPRMIADLTHVGYAIVYRADALVTWDAKTLARPRVRTIVQAHCGREQRAAPLIGSPREVVEWLRLRM
jgi:predicted nucleic acid-binding protein